MPLDCTERKTILTSRTHDRGRESPTHARMRRTRARFLAACLTALPCLGTPLIAHSATAEEIGLEIAREARALEKGFGNFKAHQTMVLRNRQGQEVEKFTWKYLRDEPCYELTCTVSERILTDRKSGYSRQLVWRDKDHLRPRKVEYYDRKDEHMKTLTIANYQQFLDRYWYSGEMTMENLQPVVHQRRNICPVRCR